MTTYADWFSGARRAFVLNHLIAARGNQLVAAEAMGIHRNTLYRMMREDGILPEHVHRIRRAQPADSKASGYPSQNIYRTTERKKINV